MYSNNMRSRSDCAHPQQAVEYDLSTDVTYDSDEVGLGLKAMIRLLV